MFDDFVRYGKKMMLSTERSDRIVGTKAIQDHYGACELKKPDVIWVESPFSIPQYRTITSVLTEIQGRVWSDFWSSIRSNVTTSVIHNVWINVFGNVWNRIPDGIYDSVVGGAIDAHLSSWILAWDTYGLSLHPAALTFMKLTEHVSWMYPGRDVVYASDRPTVINLDQNGVLHCENGPAIAWMNGDAIYAWHGVIVPEHWIKNRENLSPSEVISCEDVEQRAVGAEIIGWSKMFNVLKACIIDDSGSPDIGQLIELTLPGLDEPGRFLKAICPRNGIIVEGVPYVSDIDNLPIETALAAQAWRIGDPQSEYIHPPKRT